MIIKVILDAFESVYELRKEKNAWNEWLCNIGARLVWLYMSVPLCPQIKWHREAEKRKLWVTCGLVDLYSSPFIVFLLCGVRGRTAHTRQENMVRTQQPFGWRHLYTLVSSCFLVLRLDAVWIGFHIYIEGEYIFFFFFTNHISHHSCPLCNNRHIFSRVIL